MDADPAVVEAVDAEEEEDVVEEAAAEDAAVVVDVEEIFRLSTHCLILSKRS